MHLDFEIRPMGPDFKVEVHVLWIYVVLGPCCFSFPEVANTIERAHRAHKGLREHIHTHIHKPCTLILKSGPCGPDFKVEVHVLWIYVLLWSC